MLGFVNIIKPTGVSSGYVVNRIKRLTKEKVGHLGTLDPLATGVLPIAVGRATRFFDYFLKKDKKYFALAKFGVETDTLDSEGKIVSTSNVKISFEDVKKVASELIGETMQMPPIFSAKSVGGVRAYEAAINNQPIELEPKKINIYSIEVEPWVQEGIFALNIHCSSGTYVRAIIRDIAEELGTKATTVAIIRTKSGKFEMDSAITLEEFEKNIKSSLIKVNDILNFSRIDLTPNLAKDLFSGKEVEYQCEDGEYITYLDNEEFSIVEASKNKIKNKMYLYYKDKV
ncbi:MAG: tRNA pseudouridine(55) synthase TruB [Clostridia bacterium]|nr:tRNA pseudouridine(55) synthase TruB [Clostridia bacterium]